VLAARGNVGVEGIAHQTFAVAIDLKPLAAKERDDLTKPQLSSKTDAERQAELTRLNAKLYTVVKAQFDKSRPAVANVPRLCAQW